MKSKILLLIFIIFSGIANSQQSTHFKIDPYFSALIVKNIDSSVKWYESTLGLKTRFLPDVPQGIKVAIMESPDIIIEMIENIAWLDPKTLLEGKPEGTRIQGYFKIGFKVTALDAFIDHLKKLNISIPRIYKDDKSGKRNFLVEDPDKNLVQFFE